MTSSVFRADSVFRRLSDEAFNRHQEVRYDKEINVFVTTTVFCYNVLRSCLVSCKRSLIGATQSAVKVVVVTITASQSHVSTSVRRAAMQCDEELDRTVTND